MQTYNYISLTIEQGIGSLTIERPKVLNALSTEVLEELELMIDDISMMETIDVLLLTGAGEKAFVAGADIAEMKEKRVFEGRTFSEVGNRVFSKLANLRQPTIACVNGFALGGGCELALACDMRIGAENAKFGQPEVGLGIIPGFGGTQRLARLVGTGMAKELIFTGNIIDAKEAHRIGLLNRVVPAEELLIEAQNLANQIRKNAPLAVELSKEVIDRGLEMPIEHGLRLEAEVFGSLFSTDDQTEGMDAFLNRRKAAFNKQ
ncbi:enoyl-CoA hydratase-related protein [Vagococcus xieshaowenii]|uniref:Crotonase n=1 Tax=Vagococcus xieshaowenii TaxID=2562451 RepID=A0AAJ5EEP1_9ENTE|nr:enoyl-CoA hydratase-related protein [Vagococcus xieshaowenii]QCA28107.1 crotonase [Vagococcus xieshaowenii]TFZ40150.1 crotonase [Vagococcus xieshaowenii]